MPKYLITGAAGFIGSNLVEELINNNHTVIGLDNLSTGQRQNIDSIKNHEKKRKLYLHRR